MFHFKTLLAFVLAATAVSAVPLQKRIAQTIADSTADWEKACLAAGGAGKCNPISQTAFTSLLAAGGNCDQQDAADQMIDLAKQLNNDADMIRLAQIFVQQPRNAPDSLQVPYCQTAPKNAELNGFFHCQFAGSDFTKFSGDQTGNLPLGLNAVNPPGSCPAKTDGPVPDGVQLNTLVQSPGTPEGASGSASGSGGAGASGSGAGASDSGVDASTAVSGADATATATATDAPSTIAVGAGKGVSGASNNIPATCPTKVVNGSGASGASSVDSGVGDATTAAPAAAFSPATGAGSATGSGAAPAGTKPFTLQNGLDAQKGNAAAADLSEGSPCTDGETTCAGTQVGQCAGGKLVTTACSGGTQCFVLPLVNKAGTSAACTTEADASARIAATGATGGITGA
ncbi:uncharacterized protein FOMMEDRAFT_142744 [Fomitiporia mediterranea MF3/22]|uniref:uncharacterized protein n=1 Tax=Fomitiporia mediterranea (strain MF3/22) TaxID=694068 RepID=UPI0004408B34|nr:uncharacterized protein FOMMEDRAFT_142744 [Fomitiporia mediterranea MF3/22]EJC99441.1 hypothetical protein FOMMEDRAFT_142744 [Fomitiporia mediterranea MF3/22]